MLQKLSGLGECDPLWHYLGTVDEIVRRYYQDDWDVVRRSQSDLELNVAWLDYLGHPRERKTVSEDETTKNH